MFSEDPEVKYGHIPAADLRPLVASVELAMRHMSAIAQVPPHYLLGQIANVSADGLMAASIGLDRKNEELASLLGEGLERVFRVAADMRGEFDASSGEDFGEVMWADRSNQSIGAVADALGKFAQMLGVPQRGLWEMVPGVTRNQLDKWRELWRQEREQQFGYGASLDESDFEEFLVRSVRDGLLLHTTGADLDKHLRRHVLNARRRENTYGVSFGKEYRHSPNKVDGYAALVAAAAAWDAVRQSGKRRRGGRSWVL